jgi:hypothetical protein
LERSWLPSSHFAKFVSIVRNLLVLALFVPTMAYADRSDPAFLGVGMSSGPNEPCRIDSVTKDSGAHSAGLRTGDIVISVDGEQVINCDALVAVIQQREPGTQVKVEVNRFEERVTFSARLYSRAEVLRQRFVGHALPPTNVFRVEDESEVDLAIRGKTTIVGWFDPNCANCSPVFSRVAKWSRDKTTRTSPITAVATTTTGGRSMAEAFMQLKPEQRKLDVPLFVTDAATYQSLTINDAKRMSFMVVDCKGVVQHIVPVKPDADDLDAVLEELYTATEQAQRLKR